MKIFLLTALLALLLTGCSAKKDPSAVSATAKRPAADVIAGKATAERVCKACHGLDGRGVAPGIPNLTAQREQYLFASLNEYKQGQRIHAALKEMAASMSEADKRNVVAYYAGLPPLANAAGKDAKGSSLYEEGKVLAVNCAKCHGADDNSKVPGK